MFVSWFLFLVCDSTKLKSICHARDSTDQYFFDANAWLDHERECGWVLQGLSCVSKTILLSPALSSIGWRRGRIARWASQFTGTWTRHARSLGLIFLMLMR